jgi:hypothetical protein
MTEMKRKRDSVRRERRTERELKGREDRERESERGRETEKRDMFQQTMKKALLTSLNRIYYSRYFG